MLLMPLKIGKTPAAGSPQSNIGNARWRKTKFDQCRQHVAGQLRIRYAPGHLIIPLWIDGPRYRSSHRPTRAMRWRSAHRPGDRRIFCASCCCTTSLSKEIWVDWNRAHHVSRWLSVCALAPTQPAFLRGCARAPLHPVGARGHEPRDN